MNRYFYIDSEGKQKGTFSPEELKNENIKRDTLVWTQGMSEWMRASDISELNALFIESAGYYPPQQPAPQPVTPPVQQPGAYLGTQPRTQQMPPKSWLVESILVTVLPFILCSSIFSLLGIIGIVSASKVESLFQRGDYAAALEASNQAGKWTKITLWISIAWVLLWIIAIVAIFIFAGSLASISEMVGGNSGYEI